MMSDFERKLRFRFVAVTKDEAFFGPVRRGMTDAALAMNAEVEFTGSAGVDTDEMAALALDALECGYDGIAIDIIEPEAFRAVIAKARAAGVPVVAFNINAGNGSAGNLSGIAQHFKAAGHMLGTRALPQLGAGGSVLVTQHDAGISALEERRDGILEALAGRGVGIVELVTGHHQEEASRLIGATLAKNPAISAVLATGQADTEGAALAISASGRSIYAAGFDLSPAILTAITAGVLDFTLDQQPYTQGFYPVLQLALYCRFGLMPVDMDAGAAIIDASNAARITTLAAAGYR